MKEEEFNTVARELSQATLSDTQKREMLGRIYEAAGGGSANGGRAASPWSGAFFFAHRYAITCAFVLMLASGLSLASAQSLPGDALYDLKVNFLEPVALTARWSEESRNEYKITLLQKRILEIEELKRTGRITPRSYYDSYAATERNVTDLEHSPIFDEQGGNERVSAAIESYNALVEEDFQIMTFIEATIDINESATSSVPEALEIELPDIAPVVEEVVRPVATLAEEVTQTIEPIAPLAEEVSAPIRNLVDPIKGGLGL